MNIYILSRSRKGQPLEPEAARHSLDEARRYCNEKWLVDLYRVAPGIWKGTWNQFDEVFCHRLDLPERAA